MKNKKLKYKFLKFLLATVMIFSLTAPDVFADARTDSLVDSTVTAIPDSSVGGAADSPCNFISPEKPFYDGKVISVRRKLKVDQGEEFRVKIFIKNTGNLPWFSKQSICNTAKVSLGTDRKRDHDSIFFGTKGWEASNRVNMDQLRVDPGKIASFTFYSKSPDKDAVYKEYLTPVVEGVTWMDKAISSFEVIVGNPVESARDVRQKIQYASRSGDVLAMIDLNGERKLHIDLAKQIMTVYLGNEAIKQFKVSTGASGTPTPTGTHTVVGKQDVRIGNKKPYYIMPNFQMLSINGRGFNGVGIHALPSLGSSQLRSRIRGLQAQGLPIPTSIYKDDTLWNEAVSHLGRPVSHGCVRVSPEDAKFIFEYTVIGETKVIVERASDVEIL